MIRIDWDDDELWELTRGRRGYRSKPDPLTARVLELRAQTPRELRRRIDVLKYSPSGQRVYRLSRKTRRTTTEQLEVDQHERLLEDLYEQLRRYTTKG